MELPLRAAGFIPAILIVSALGAQQPTAGQQAKKPGADPPLDTVARVAKDMQAAEQRLGKSDPGDETRKLQRDVIDGLDDLIKQNTKPQSGGQGGASGMMQQDEANKRSGGQSGAAQKKNAQSGQQSDFKDAATGSDQDQPGRAKGGKDSDPQGTQKDKGQGKAVGEDGKGGTAKQAGKQGDDKENQKGEAKGNESNQGQQGGQGIVKNDKTPKAQPNLTAETYRTDWGHLPLMKRLEMDAYSKERFMPRYDEILQQYYRAVAEQGRKK
jgi:hypothetical protein